MSESKPTSATKAPRSFKTEWFAKAAKKTGIKDEELCKAIELVRKGQADYLGGGVFKKRLNKNMHRSIISGKGGKYCTSIFMPRKIAKTSKKTN